MSSTFETLSFICGIVYTASWGISFYPQVYLNWKRKSVVGMSLDFQLLNVTGYVAYSLFNCLLKSVLADQYLVKYGPPIPVDWSDIVFAVHGLLITLVTIAQCFIYDTGGQMPSIPSVVLAAALWASMDTALFLAGFGAISWLDMVYWFSYCKLTVTATKYFPQAFLNYRRKSTVGFAIVGILLDFNGGLWSFAQQSLDAIHAGNASVFINNPVKFGLSMLSIGFDIVFIVQHYCLYRHARADATTTTTTQQQQSSTIDSTEQPLLGATDDTNSSLKADI